jgi:hypothetical protein
VWAEEAFLMKTTISQSGEIGHFTELLKFLLQADGCAAAFLDPRIIEVTGKIAKGANHFFDLVLLQPLR